MYNYTLCDLLLFSQLCWQNLQPSYLWRTKSLWALIICFDYTVYELKNYSNYREPDAKIPFFDLLSRTVGAGFESRAIKILPASTPLQERRRLTCVILIVIRHIWCVISDLSVAFIMTNLKYCQMSSDKVPSRWRLVSGDSAGRNAIKSSPPAGSFNSLTMFSFLFEKKKESRGLKRVLGGEVIPLRDVCLSLA